VYIRCITIGAIALALAGCRPEFDNTTQYMMEAQQALANGDQNAAIEKYTAAIESSSDPTAYFERARLYADLGRLEEATADCNKAKELGYKAADVDWLSKQIQRPEAQRFRGPQALPPSHNK